MHPTNDDDQIAHFMFFKNKSVNLKSFCAIAKLIYVHKYFQKEAEREEQAKKEELIKKFFDNNPSSSSSSSSPKTDCDSISNMANGRDKELPSFWLPSLTPSSKPTELTKPVSVDVVHCCCSWNNIIDSSSWWLRSCNALDVVRLNEWTN